MLIKKVLIFLHFSYRARPRTYYSGSVGALIVYDITQKETFVNVENKWLKGLRDYTHDQPVVVMLIGNKADLAYLRVVPTDEAREFSEREYTLFMEASVALDSLNVETAFTTLIAQVYFVINGYTLCMPKNLAYITKGQSITIEGKDDCESFEWRGVYIRSTLTPRVVIITFCNPSVNYLCMVSY